MPTVTLHQKWWNSKTSSLRRFQRTVDFCTLVPNTCIPLYINTSNRWLVEFWCFRMRKNYEYYKTTRSSCKSGKIKFKMSARANKHSNANSEVKFVPKEYVGELKELYVRLRDVMSKWGKNVGNKFKKNISRNCRKPNVNCVVILVAPRYALQKNYIL